MRDYFRPSSDSRPVGDYSEDIGHRAPILSIPSGRRQCARRMTRAPRSDSLPQGHNGDRAGEGTGDAEQAQPFSRFGRVLRSTRLLDPSHSQYGTRQPDSARQVLVMTSSATYPTGARIPRHILLEDLRHPIARDLYLAPSKIGHHSGLGLFHASGIVVPGIGQRGVWVCECRGSRFTRSQLNEPGRNLDYTFFNSQGSSGVDGLEGGGWGQNANNHFDPTMVNAEVRRGGKKWYMYALEEIPPHGEIFIDYGRSYFLTRLQALFTRRERLSDQECSLLGAGTVYRY